MTVLAAMLEWFQQKIHSQYISGLNHCHNTLNHCSFWWWFANSTGTIFTKLSLPILGYTKIIWIMFLDVYAIKYYFYHMTDITVTFWCLATYTIFQIHSIYYIIYTLNLFAKKTLWIRSQMKTQSQWIT